MQKLNLSNNQITNIENFDCKQLAKLSLSNNPLQNILFYNKSFHFIEFIWFIFLFFLYIWFSLYYINSFILRLNKIIIICVNVTANNKLFFLFLAFSFLFSVFFSVLFVSNSFCFFSNSFNLFYSFYKLISLFSS